ncbi:fasciclin domain-containing protein [Lewinella sp. 4G2]|uniref:fasciclin domain-containing protein n=1 Tax=Lewinella sp. 4G2 TaxID=1803372 RepID=UPI0007B4801E|nr:fasciclin domain-containing protein [Lewinella sp. 4G2]OAV46148.1 hypothetical protein A3850_017975 [Lewinella sp. 4G2]
MNSLFVLLLVFTGFASAGLHAQEESPTNMADALAADASTSTLLSALNAAELTDALSTDGTFILLAPTNDAFEKLPESTVAGLMAPDNVDALRSLLQFHLLSGAEDGGGEMASEKIEAAGASVTRTIDCTNGTIYLIDTVLPPPPMQEEGGE